MVFIITQFFNENNIIIKDSSNNIIDPSNNVLTPINYRPTDCIVGTWSDCTNGRMTREIIPAINGGKPCTKKEKITTQSCKNCVVMPWYSCVYGKRKRTIIPGLNTTCAEKKIEENCKDKNTSNNYVQIPTITTNPVADISISTVGAAGGAINDFLIIKKYVEEIIKPSISSLTFYNEDYKITFINSILGTAFETYMGNKPYDTSVLKHDDWALIGYDNFVSNLDNLGLDANTKVPDTFTLNRVFNNIISEVKSTYYSTNIITPYEKITDEEIKRDLLQIINDYIDLELKNFFYTSYNFVDNSGNIFIPELDKMINDFIKTDPYYRTTYFNFTEDYIIPFIEKKISNLVNAYIEKQIDITMYLVDENIGYIKKKLCTKYEGSYKNNLCSLKTKNDCDNFTDPSNNIFTTFNNDTCKTSVQSGLRQLVEQNTVDNDITYDSDNERAILSAEYCSRKGLEYFIDLNGNVDCKFKDNTRSGRIDTAFGQYNEPNTDGMLDSVFGPLVQTINKNIFADDYDQCEIHEFDASSNIPADLQTLVAPLYNKYGDIKKSLCFNKTYGCIPGTSLINGLCKGCPSGYKNKPATTECYKIYDEFDHIKGVEQPVETLIRKLVEIYSDPICEDPEYSYNEIEKKCIGKCPANYIYTDDHCVANAPLIWDGIVEDDEIIKNKIYLPSQVKVHKCMNRTKPNLIDGLCYADCPGPTSYTKSDGTKVLQTYERTKGAPYVCRLEPCPDGYHRTGVNTCYRHARTEIATIPRGAVQQRWKCPTKNGNISYTNNQGVCWANSCPGGWRKTSEGMCMQDCDTNNGWVSNGAGLCYQIDCPVANGDELAYHKSSPGFCMQECKNGYSNVAGVCWKDKGVYGRGVGYPVTLNACPTGQRDDGTACWNIISCVTNGFHNKTAGCVGCHEPPHDECKSDCYWTWITQSIDCTDGNKTMEVWDRYKCKEGTTDEVDGALCYPKCLQGYKKSTANICQWDGDLSYVPKSIAHPTMTPESKKLDSYFAVCPDDRETIDGLCYPNCPPGYISKASSGNVAVCEKETCSPDWYKTEAGTCQLDASTWANVNIGVGDIPVLECPNGTTEHLGICYPDAFPSNIASLYNINRYERIPSSIEFLWEKCPIGWNDNWNKEGCTRPKNPMNDKKDWICPFGYVKDGDKCKKVCNDDYELLNNKCVQKCPSDTVNNTNTTCGRLRITMDSENTTTPFNYRIKYRKNPLNFKNSGNIKA